MDHPPHLSMQPRHPPGQAESPLKDPDQETHPLLAGRRGLAAARLSLRSQMDAGTSGKQARTRTQCSGPMGSPHGLLVSQSTQLSMTLT